MVDNLPGDPAGERTCSGDVLNIGELPAKESNKAKSGKWIATRNRIGVDSESPVRIID